MNSCRFLLVSMLLFSACEVIEQEPQSNITAESFFKTAKDADAAILGCYDALQPEAIRLVVWGEGRTDLYDVNDRTTNNEQQIIQGNVDANNEQYNSWNGIYRGINRVNGVLKFVPGITDPALAARKERILGEAYFLRGLMYFYLVRTFENVPLLLEPYTSTTQNFFPTQSDPQTLYAQIESDLKEAEGRVPDTYSAALETKGRATKGAIRAALMDLYLWQKKNQDAANLGAQIISSPANYSLVPGAGYANIFTAKNTSESIFELQYNNAYLERENNGNLQNNGLVDLFLPLGQVTPVYPGGNWRMIPSAKLRDAFAPGDLRRSATFQFTPTPAPPWRDANIPYVNKYIGTVTGPIRYQDANLVLYRLADVILMRAEALNELGQTAAAITELNRIRTRAGLANTTAASQADISLAIENERFVELAYEGKRYFDLKRTGRYAAATGKTNPNWTRWPIANSELLGNKNLAQNPGY